MVVTWDPVSTRQRHLISDTNASVSLALPTSLSINTVECWRLPGQFVLLPATLPLVEAGVRLTEWRWGS